MKCPYCHRKISDSLLAAELGKRGGSVSSPAKTVAVRLNARKGGRPRKKPAPPVSPPPEP